MCVGLLYCLKLEYTYKHIYNFIVHGLMLEKKKKANLHQFSNWRQCTVSPAGCRPGLGLKGETWWQAGAKEMRTRESLAFWESVGEAKSGPNNSDVEGDQVNPRTYGDAIKK